MATATACAAVVAALALAANVPGAVRGFHGAFEGGGTTGFRAQFNDGGKPKQVRSFHWRDLQAACDEGNIMLRGVLDFTVLVNRRGKFSAVGMGGGDRARLEGEFTNGGRRANGFLRVQGSFPTGQGVYHDCDTQQAEWRAGR